MKIALINENSQAAKNALICDTLKKVVEPLGHEVHNYGMYSAEDAEQLTYVQIGILAATLLNSGACDLVITGCGTGEGAMLACNSFPGCRYLWHKNYKEYFIMDGMCGKEYPFFNAWKTIYPKKYDFVNVLYCSFGLLYIMYFTRLPKWFSGK